MDNDYKKVRENILINALGNRRNKNANADPHEAH